MPSLKHLRNRISSVKSTRKITSAMKMVAASKLRQSQDQENNGKHYSSSMDDLLQRALANVDAETQKKYPLLTGTGKEEKHVVVVVTSDRGLCGGFNSSLLREARQYIDVLVQKDKHVYIICIGRKGHDALRREYGDLILNAYTDIYKPRLSFHTAEAAAQELRSLYNEGVFDVAHVFYNRFQNAITQVPTCEQIIPCKIDIKDDDKKEQAEDDNNLSVFDPTPKEMLPVLLPRVIATHVYKVLLNSAAGEHAARMNAMDNATNNAGDMIDDLSLEYNRARQANITSELIEIISAMEAM